MTCRYECVICGRKNVWERMECLELKERTIVFCKGCYKGLKNHFEEGGK